MKRSFRLTCFPLRCLLLRLLPPLIITYAVLLPAQLSLFPAKDTLQAARNWYGFAQVFLAICALWPQFIYFLFVCQKDCRELLQSLKHPDLKCSIVLLLEHQIRTLPAYIIYMFMLPGQCPMISVLILQSVCITAGFLLFTFLSGSAVFGSVTLLAYILISAIAGNLQFPLLIQMNCLWNELEPSYFAARAICLLLMSGIYLLIKSKYKRLI